MNYILNLETATKNCSVSISKEGETISFREKADEGYSHAEYLHIFIQEVIQEAGINYSDLVAVAVSRGPGSYTGLRIGVSAAKGLCFALDIPLLALDTLQILAAQVSINKGFIIPMLDARRMEVYSCILDASYNEIRQVEAEIITENSFKTISETSYIVGDCAEKCKSVLDSENIIFLENIKYPSSKEMGRFSFAKFQKKEFENLAYFEPFYLKDFITTSSMKSNRSTSH